MIRVDAHPRGRRLYVLGRRLHHGPLGFALAAAFTIARRPRLALAATIYAATDARDFPWRDCDNH